MNTTTHLLPAAVLVPDVHGRTFWESALPFALQGVDTIFLGDYLDPYAAEGITPADAIGVFRRILDLAERHPNVQLLLGNHDCGYIFDPTVCDCRMDHEHYELLRSLFLDHRHLFRICTTVACGAGRAVVSHAGICRRWVDKWRSDLFADGKVDFATLPQQVNRMVCDEGFWLPLCDVGPSRGGRHRAGSPVWAGLDEFCDPKAFIPAHQVVGHTLQLGNPFNGRPAPIARLRGGEHTLYCIDTRRCYCLRGQLPPVPLHPLPIENEQ